jgi:hypothetical protein
MNGNITFSLKGQKIFFFFSGAILGLLVFSLTLIIFDAWFRPRLFPGLPSWRSSSDLDLEERGAEVRYRWDE